MSASCVVTLLLTMLRSLSLSALSLLFLACSGDEPSQTTLPQFSGLQPGAAPGSGSGEVPSAPSPEQPAEPSEPGSSTPGSSTPGGPEGGPAVGGLAAPAPAEGTSGETQPAPTEPAPMEPAPAEPAPMEPATPSFPPSAGCGNAAPPQGAGSLTIRGAQADYLITLPPNYDPNTPTPLIFGFHGRGRTHVQFQTVDASQIQTELGSRAVMVYMKSQGGNGWNNAAEVAPSVEFFEALYPQVLGNYCVDTAQVFVIGHSSGAMFSQILACRFGERFRGVAAIAGRQQETSCSPGRVPALLIHGTTDTVVPFADGVAAREFYLARNGCDAASAVAAVSPCVAHQGCDAGLPVQWCQHTEPTYTDANTGQPTNHGWPSFASRAINSFFFSLPPRDG